MKDLKIAEPTILPVLPHFHIVPVQHKDLRSEHTGRNLCISKIGEMIHGNILNHLNFEYLAPDELDHPKENGIYLIHIENWSEQGVDPFYITAGSPASIDHLLSSTLEKWILKLSNSFDISNDSYIQLEQASRVIKRYVKLLTVCDELSLSDSKCVVNHESNDLTVPLSSDLLNAKLTLDNVLAKHLTTSLHFYPKLVFVTENESGVTLSTISRKNLDTTIYRTINGSLPIVVIIRLITQLREEAFNSPLTDITIDLSAFKLKGHEKSNSVKPQSKSTGMSSNTVISNQTVQPSTDITKVESSSIFSEKNASKLLKLVGDKLTELASITDDNASAVLCVTEDVSMVMNAMQKAYVLDMLSKSKTAHLEIKPSENVLTPNAFSITLVSTPPFNAML